MSPAVPRAVLASVAALEAQDPVLAALLNAPLDDEPFSEEGRAAFEEAVEDYRSGRVHMYSSEEVHAMIEQAPHDSDE